MKKAFKIRFIIYLLVIFTLFYARFVEPLRLVVNEVKVSATENVPKTKVVVFSDTHFGKLYKDENILKIVKTINEQDADIVIFTGDFFDNLARDKDILNLDLLWDNMGKINAKYGKFAIYGNHDIGGGSYNEYKDKMKDAGFKLMNNENVFIDDLNIRVIGFDDALLGSTNKELYNIKSTDFNIILSHEPDVSDLITTDIENKSLMVSGHTHGGQVYIPYLTKYFLPPMGEKYIRGLYENVGVNENLSLFVTRGIGVTFFPFRFLSVPEVSVITLN